MPEGVKFPRNADLWQPLDLARSRTVRNQRHLSGFGRLARLRRETGESGCRHCRRLETQFPDTNKNMGVAGDDVQRALQRRADPAIFLSLLGAVGFVLLIACANVANLLLRGRRTARARWRSGWRSAPAAADRPSAADGERAAGLDRRAVGPRPGAFQREAASMRGRERRQAAWIVFTFDPRVFG